MFEGAIIKGHLPPTLQGFIKSIPKPKKDQLNIDNWRTTTLLNNDAKIFASIFAKRLKMGLAEMIDEEQSGFMPGRWIINNVRLILDLLDYNEYIAEDSLVLFVDFYKAFDTVNHTKNTKNLWIWRSIQTLYYGCNSSVKLAHGTSRVSIEGGIKPTHLPACCTDVKIRMTHFQGINAFLREFKISQLADDTAIFINNQTEVRTVIDCIKEFSEVSGLRMNVGKSVLLPHFIITLIYLL